MGKEKGVRFALTRGRKFEKLGGIRLLDSLLNHSVSRN
jgi:hypothetical protein